jgi:hypothetical protein
MFATIGRVMTTYDQTLKLRCTACGHEDEWTREKALATLGPDTCPNFVRHRIVCGRCYSRRRTEVWI